MAQIKQGRWVTQSGQGTSSSLELVTETLVGIYTPSTLDAAELKIQASPDGASFYDIVEGGAAMTVTADTDAYIPLEATKMLGASHVRVIHLDGGGSPTTESAERVFQPVFRTFD